MEHTKLGTNEEMPTGEATVTTTAMHRDRDSIDDFEHVDRESSPIDKTSKTVSEFEFDRSSHDLEVQYVPKQSIEAKVVGLPESSTAFADEWAAQTKNLIDSSGLENFLRNEKGFMSSELNVGPGLGELKSDMSKITLTDTGNQDNAAFPEKMFGGQEKLSNTQFISTEASHDSEKEKEDLLRRPDDDSSLKTESGLGLPGAGDKVSEGFKTPMFDDDFLKDTFQSAKSAAAEKISTEALGPSSFINDVTQPAEPIFEHEPKDMSSTEYANKKDLPSKQPELKDLPSKQPDLKDLPSKQEPKDLPSKQEQKDLPLKKEPTSTPLKRQEPTDLPLKQEPVDLPAPVKQQPATDPLVTATKPREPKREEVMDEPAKEVAVDEITEPMELFCKMGLVVELVYWRDPKKSGVVFGTVLGILLSLSYFSLISVIAYLSLAVLTGTIAYRIYKNIVQAVQKTSDGHPFKEILDLDLTLPQDKVRELTDMTVNHLNAGAVELRRLFLVEDLVDSIKFGVLLWCMTYVGSWFNGMTIIIIMFVAMFTLPKVYENNKTQIDQNLEIVRGKLAEVSAKVKAAVPIGKKPVEEKKEQ